MLRRNVDLTDPQPASNWRGFCSSWRWTAPPRVHTPMKVNAEPALAYLERLNARRSHYSPRITLTHLLAKSTAMILGRSPQLNAVQRFGRTYPRRSTDVFFHVAGDVGEESLRGYTVRNADKKSLLEIAHELAARVRRIRTRTKAGQPQAPDRPTWLPGFVMPLAHWVLEFCLYSLNLWSPALGAPRDRFGSMMVTNTGPSNASGRPALTPTRVPVVLTLATIQEWPAIRRDHVAAARVLHVSFSFDGELVDAAQAQSFSRALKRVLAAPEHELESQSRSESDGRNPSPLPDDLPAAVEDPRPRAGPAAVAETCQE